MQYIKLTVIACTVVAYLFSPFAPMGWADDHNGTDKKTTPIIEKPPKVLTTTEKNLPMSTGTKVFWGVLAAALIAGAAAAASGGGSGSGTNSPAGGTDTGSVTFGW